MFGNGQKPQSMALMVLPCIRSTMIFRLQPSMVSIISSKVARGSPQVMKPLLRHAMRFVDILSTRWLPLCGIRKIRQMAEVNVYETDELISQYLEFHYGAEYFGVANFCVNGVQQAPQ